MIYEDASVISANALKDLKQLNERKQILERELLAELPSARQKPSGFS
jgi:hypothetical protein